MLYKTQQNYTTSHNITDFAKLNKSYTQLHKTLQTYTALLQHKTIQHFAELYKTFSNLTRLYKHKNKKHYTQIYKILQNSTKLNNTVHNFF